MHFQNRGVLSENRNLYKVSYMERSSKIYVAGHRGMVGSAIVRKLRDAGYDNLVLRSSKQLDLRDQKAVDAFFAEEKPEYVFMAAAKVGGIHANNAYGAEFIYDNLMIGVNVVHASYQHSVKKLLYPGSSCIYPKLAPQPLKEEYLLTGLLEPTNEPYAIAKISGIKLCESYRRLYGCNFFSVMPTNIYGYNDNYHPENSHVLPALIRKFHEAKMNENYSVTIWGTGNPRREFLFADDLAEACIYLMCHYNGHELINIGTGEDIMIRDLAELVKETVGFEGQLFFDSSKPDGAPRKLMDVSRLHGLGYRHKVELNEGIKLAYDDFKKKLVEAEVRKSVSGKAVSAGETVEVLE